MIAGFFDLCYNNIVCSYIMQPMFKGMFEYEKGLKNKANKQKSQKTKSPSYVRRYVDTGNSQ